MCDPLSINKFVCVFLQDPFEHHQFRYTKSQYVYIKIIGKIMILKGSHDYR